MKRVSNKYYIHVKNRVDGLTDEFREIYGERILNKLYPELDLFVHPVMDGLEKTQGWIVSEGKTGAAFISTVADIKEKSILLALDLIIDKGVDRTIAKTEKMITKHGLSPRYEP